jgi:hypothetical protein
MVPQNFSNFKAVQGEWTSVITALDHALFLDYITYEYSFQLSNTRRPIARWNGNEFYVSLVQATIYLGLLLFTETAIQSEVRSIPILRITTFYNNGVLEY